jgi:hypothetical protein
MSGEKAKNKGVFWKVSCQWIFKFIVFFLFFFLFFHFRFFIIVYFLKVPLFFAFSPYLILIKKKNIERKSHLACDIKHQAECIV